jgi:hypothetical protein
MQRRPEILLCAPGTDMFLEVLWPEKQSPGE